MTKSDAPDPVIAGQPLTYTLDRRECRSSECDRCLGHRPLPARVTFDSATPSQGTCSESSGTVTCALGTIANGQGASVGIKVRKSTAGHDHQSGGGHFRRR